MGASTAEDGVGVLRGAAVSTTDDLAWIGGGVVHRSVDGGESERQVFANSVLSAVDSTGSVREIELPVEDGAFAFDVTVEEVSRGPHAILTTCAIASTDVVGCATEPTVEVLSIDASAATRVAQVSPVAEWKQPGDGLVTVAGSLDDRVYLTQRTGPGNYPGTSTVRLLEIDSATGSEREIALPDGVLTPDSVCVDQRGAVAIAPVLDSSANVTGAVVSASDDLSTWRTIGEVSIPPVLATGGGVTCLTDDLLIRIAGATTAVVMVDRATAALYSGDDGPTGIVTFLDDRSPAPILTTVNPEVPTAVAYWEYRGRGQWSQRGSRTAAADDGVPAGVELDGRIVDVANLRSTPPGQESRRPRPYEVATASPTTKDDE